MRVGVYGTLMSGEYNHSVMAVAEGVPVTDCWVEGKLYDLGSFPGLKEGKGMVRCELFVTKTLAPLDSLEGHPRFYKRKEVPLYLDENKDLEVCKAWVYFYNDTPPEENLIRNGDWIEWQIEQKQFLSKT